jgi:hypothetical protein
MSNNTTGENIIWIPFTGDEGQQTHTTVSNCYFTGNRLSAPVYTEETPLSLANCKFINNEEPHGTWAGLVQGENADITISNCVFARNLMHGAPSVFFRNDMMEPMGKLHITNSTFDDTGAVLHRMRDDDEIVIENSILLGAVVDWPPVPMAQGVMALGAKPISITYSMVEGPAPGEGNIPPDYPLFVNPEAGDFRLLPNTPCVDAGNPAPEYNDGARPPGLGTERNDMGAYGGPGNVGWLPEPPPSEPKLHALLMGVDDIGWDKNSNWFVVQRGQADARAIEGKLSDFSMYEASTLLPFDYDTTGDTSATEVFTALEHRIEPNVVAGDLFVFYFAGHGLGGKLIDEDIGFNETGAENAITDDELVAWFDSDIMVNGRMRRDIWANVNKLFILDSCGSGGFGRSEDLWPEDDLMSLPHTALLAACEEDELTGTAVFPPWDLGRGKFTLMLEKALDIADGYARADVDKNGLSFAELESFLRDEVAQSTDYDGYIRLHPCGDDDFALQTFHPSYFAWASDDFEMSLLPIPEPSTLFLLLIGSGGIAIRRRRSGR